MADAYDRDYGRGRRGKRGRRRDYYGDRDDYHREDRSSPASQSQPAIKAPIILAKPPRDNHQGLVGSPQSQGDYDFGKSQDSHLVGRHCSESDTGSQPSVQDKPPVIMVRPKDEARPSPPTLLTRPKQSTNEENSSPGPASGSTYHIQQRKTSVPSGAISLSQGSTSSVSGSTTGGPISLKGANTGRISVIPRMTQSVKLIDDSYNWCDAGMEMLIDQTDLLTIGVIGMQGVGKSTLLSVLAGNDYNSTYKEYVFKPQTKEMRELGAHQTMGIDMFVTPERVVLLDTQPVLSASVLDRLVQHDKKYPPEYSTAENCVEMQSLQTASFLMTVCNVVIVVLDWFVDLNLLKFIQTAEMLKPATPTSSHESSTSEVNEYYPYIVFVLNKADREDFSVENYRAMQEVIMKIFEKSKLKFTGPVTIANGKLVPGLNRNTIQHNANLFLVPPAKDKQSEKDETLVTQMASEYSGHPGFENLTRVLRNKLFSMPRRLLTHTTLSEKNWFHYAARSWEAIKKSQLFVEYNRLLP